MAAEGDRAFLGLHAFAKALVSDHGITRAEALGLLRHLSDGCRGEQRDTVFGVMDCLVSWTPSDELRIRSSGDRDGL